MVGESREFPLRSVGDVTEMRSLGRGPNGNSDEPAGSGYVGGGSGQKPSMEVSLEQADCIGRVGSGRDERLAAEGPEVR